MTYVTPRKTVTRQHIYEDMQVHFCNDIENVFSYPLRFFLYKISTFDFHFNFHFLFRPHFLGVLKRLAFNLLPDDFN